MFKRRRSGPIVTDTAPENFSVRWHTIANPATPSLDIMSSPDPLNEEDSYFAPPSSHRSTRSRLSPVRVRSDSPRKQQYELEYGDHRSRSKLLVTLEPQDVAPPGATARKLYSSSPFAHRNAGAITTKVPLKQSVEDDLGPSDQATPRKRGRPRKTNGTPLPSAAKRRKTVTPLGQGATRRNTASELDPLSGAESQATPVSTARNSQGRSLKSLIQPPSDLGLGAEPSSDMVSIPTPTPRRRGRPPKSKSVEPSSVAKESAKTGRRRRQALLPEDLEAINKAIPEEAEMTREDDKDPAQLPSDAVETKHQERSSPQGPYSDIWMNPMPNLETPRLQLPNPKPTSGPLAKSHISIPSSATSETDSESSGPEGYAADAPSISDAGSIMDAPTYHGPRNDTIAQEDFSMIFVDSIHSYQEFKSSAAGRAPTNLSDLDEEEERIVNTTLESLRQSRGGGAAEGFNVKMFQHEQDLEEVGVNDAEDDIANMDMDGSEEDHEDRRDLSAQQPESMVVDADNDADTMHTEIMTEPHRDESKDMVKEIAEDELNPTGDIPIPALTELPIPPTEEPGLSSSPATTYQDQAEDPAPLMSSAVQASHRGFSPRWLRTPRGSNVSPMRRKALASTAKYTRPTPLARGAEYEDMQMDSSPSRRANDDSNVYEDSFSEIPPAILEAATPGRLKVLPESEMELGSEGKKGEEEEAAAAHEVMDIVPDENDRYPVDPSELDSSEAAKPPNLDKSKPTYAEEAPSQDAPVAVAVEDTGVPEAVQTTKESESHDLHELGIGEDTPAPDHESRSHNQTQPRAPSVISSAHTDSGRLPTPDDTPENAQVEAPQKAPESSLPDQSLPRSEPDAQPQSEHAQAPQATEYLQAPQAQASIERGSHVPEITPLQQMSSPAQEPQSVESQSPQDKAPRPALSAIVRAGKVLQNVTSDPPSPEDRQPQLRSPFRSSASKESWSGSRDAGAGRRFSASPSRRPTNSHRRTISMERLSEDPFAAGSRSSTGQGSFMQALNRSMSEHAKKAPVGAGGSTASSMRITPPDDEMSWVAEAGPLDPNLRGDVSLQEVAQLTGRPSRSNEPSQVSAQGDSPPGGDDETDLWEIEASREEPNGSIPHQKLFESSPAAPPRQRTVIPSPRTKRRSLAPNISVSKSGPRPAQATKAASAAAEEDEEEYSLLDKEKRAAEAAKEPPTASKPRFDLSTFFSSPASIPGMIADKFFPTKAQNTNMTGEKAPAVPTSSMFPSAPQQQPPQPRSRMEATASSPVGTQSHQPSSQVDHGSISPETPERLERPVPARRLGPVSQQRRADTFVGRISTGPSTIPTPPRMQLSHEDIERWQQGASQATSSSESNGSPRRFLRPLPPRNASPSKSNIRSPLKPRTPGRVVEFTSSVLEPFEIAQKRQEQQRPLSIADADGTAASQRTQSPHVVNEQENQQWASERSSRFTQSRVRPSELSPSDWSKKHWTLLDDLLKARRHSPFSVAAPRQSGKLLGKTFKVKGRSTLIERWHLDVVDAFCADVGGWDAQTVCKRLFCLIVNEDRSVQKQRARQLQKQREREKDAIMFH